MAEGSAFQTRSPLSEARHRINASHGPADHLPHKTRHDHQHNHNDNGHHSHAAEQPDIRVTAPLASNPPAPGVLKPPQESDESKRLSQASYDSTSSGRSKTYYKTHIGPWQLGRTLGKGSSARVRLCRHNVTNQLAAVKIVNRRMAYLVQDSSLAALSKWDSSLPKQVNGEMRVPMAIEREVAILKLIEHPHIMRLYDIWENRSEIYLILEYIDQGDLFTYINSRGRLTEEVALYFFRQMISAIAYCHSFNICHRDLKPENILISADNKIKIADFGMAALHQTDTHQLATACGSPHYAAPELLKNRQYRGDKADIWSMGVILYAMLAAVLPFDDPDLRVMLNRTKKGQYEMPKHLSPEAEDLIRRMLQVNPERRIALKDIWRHPLVQKYSYLDNYGDNNGLPPDMRKGFQYTPVPRQDIDPQLVRQLRSMWHMFSEHDLELKLTCEAPNDQKAFYWLLHNYREKQLEDFKPELAHSMSDYHHLKPGAWKRRISTRKFSQPRANGHGRSVSRFTVISNAAEPEAEAVQSYDRHRGGRVPQPCNSQISQAKINVHRDHTGGGSAYGSQPSRARSGSNARSVRANSNSLKALNAGRAASSRGSMTSLRSNRQGTSRARGPSLRHKRGVDFSHVRRRSGSAGPSRQDMRQASSRCRVADDAGRSEQASRSQSPELPVQADCTFPKAKGAPVPAKDPTAMFTEELRRFSSNIAKDCDEAFKSPLIEDDSMTDSLDGDGRQRDSPFTFSLEGTPEATPRTDVSSVKHWDSRPLPPPSPDQKPQPQPGAMVSNQNDSYDPSLNDTDDEGPVEQVARLAIPVILSRKGERRVVSAPVQTQQAKKPTTMPSINEDKAVNVTSDKSRIVSAPPHTPPKGSGQAHGMEYLSKVENTIRVVHSPTGPDPARAPKPRNVLRKAEAAEDRGRRYNTVNEVDGNKDASSNGAQGVVGKKRSWLKRSSKANTESGASTTTESQDQVTLVGSETGPECHAGTTGAAAKKKSFNFPFFKSNKGTAPKMSIAGKRQTPPGAGRRRLTKADGPDDMSDGFEVTKAPSDRKRASWRESRASSANRNIEVKQNWLARLFRVKPATSYLCLTLSRKRARQEVAMLLREWRKYGIRGVQVDKQRNIIFARVRAKNYLKLKEVSFAAEIITVIEHGTRQPLSIVRFTQERGAASSFHRVVNTMEIVFNARHLLVEDRNKQKMMIKTLNS